MVKVLCIWMFISLAISFRATKATTDIESADYNPGDTNPACINGYWHMMESNSDLLLDLPVNCHKIEFVDNTAIMSHTKHTEVDKTVMRELYRRIDNSTNFVRVTDPRYGKSAVILQVFTDDLCKYVVVRRFSNDVADVKPPANDDVYYFMTQIIDYNRAEAEAVKARYTDGKKLKPVKYERCAYFNQ